ncbi:hypothetical protein GCM10022198_14400 [Klugiella xanthotipulae]|uniref:Ca-activated chloride channel family protein n=1 Tax=Klugiella xanthotipulae TaxID=244735 RepID=A0A543I4N5_9MICO|nr:VWA domain-containing protein [Klugiella xanthotipulae]TQM65529.1 Ca-activated chloride channel family protein [Klugiella xanthotipulae]
MIFNFQPVLNIFVLLLLVLPIVAFTVWRVVRATGNGKRLVWLGRTLMVLCVLAMLLRPGLPGGQTQTLETELDVFFVVDTTASIVAEDYGDGQQRLDGVRDDAAALVREYPGARFSLITFDATAALRVPLTTDGTSLLSTLSVLTPEITKYSRGSSISEANDLLAQTVSQAAVSAPERSRMVFYFGDGEQTSSQEPGSFTESAEWLNGGAVLGYGTAEGGKMRVTTGKVGDTAAPEYIDDSSGNPALSVIDENNLEAIAAQLGVKYQHRTADTDLTIPEVKTTTVPLATGGTVGNVIALYWIPAILCALLLSLEILRGTAQLVQLRALTKTPSQRGA